MQQLFNFYHQNSHLSGSDALSQLVTTFQNPPQSQMAFNQMQQHAVNQNFQGPPGQRTPGLNGPQFASPAAAAHLNLPNTTASPATMNMSPAMQNHALQNHMVQGQMPPTSIGMVAQQSQQGTNTSTGSQATSANTSPNATNKRRRASAVKLEGQEAVDGPEINGTGAKVKASPRVNKRQKGAP